MTVTLKNYVVEVCPRNAGNAFGYPIRKMIYTVSEKSKAEKRSEDM